MDMENYTSVELARLLKSVELNVEVSVAFSTKKGEFYHKGGRKFNPFPQDIGLFTFIELKRMFPEFLEVRNLNNGFVVYDLKEDEFMFETWSSKEVDAAAKLLLVVERNVPGALAEIEEIMMTFEEAEEIELNYEGIEITDSTLKLLKEITQKEFRKNCLAGDFGQSLQRYLVGNSNEDNTGDFLLSVKDYDCFKGTTVELSPLKDADQMAIFYVREDKAKNFNPIENNEIRSFDG